MLPVAPAATLIDDGTGSLSSPGTGAKDANHLGLDPRSVLPAGSDQHPVPWQGSGREHDPTVRPGTEGSAAGGHPVRFDLELWHDVQRMVPTDPLTAPTLIVPSVLPADFARLGAECEALEQAGVDRIQFDVMDGRFVPNLTFGPDVIAAVRPSVQVPFEAHLMMVEPDTMLERFVDAGCSTVIVHAEACPHLHRTLAAIRELGASPAVALNPHTPVTTVAHVLDLLDMVLIMTVNPGFGGQDYIATMEPKIAETRNLLDTADHWIDLEVDGGISASTIAGASRAGANVFISGSGLYRHPDGLVAATTELRELAMKANVEA